MVSLTPIGITVRDLERVAEGHSSAEAVQAVEGLLEKATYICSERSNPECPKPRS
ncbi:MAG: hypothetical protein ABH833_00980 [Parcubacteria group bacterium]